MPAASPAPPAPRRSPRRRAAFAFGAAALAFLLLEVGLRLVPLPGWWEAGIFDANILSQRLAHRVEMALEHGWNSEGYRDRPWTGADPRPRLALLGDSRIFGQYVPPPQNFGAVIDATSGWATMNFGIPGATTTEALDFIVADAARHRPAAALVCFDINASLLSFFPKGASGSRDDLALQAARSSAVYRWLELTFYAATRPRGPVMSVQTYKDELAEVLRRLARAGASRQIVLVGWTPLQDFEGLYTAARYDRFRQASRDVAAASGARVLELQEVVAGRTTAEAFVGAETIHLSVAGHRLLADAVLRTLGAP
jgi:lysophospholipase L1-like esterase